MRFLRETVYPLLFCLAGVGLAHYPILFSRFRLTQDDLVDSRFNHFVLEHGYRWAIGDPFHREFWSPPVFFPHANTLAYSDILLTAGPIYWFWRLAGSSPDTAFQLWMLAAGVLNFLAAYALLRRCIGTDPLPSAAGAFLFAFASCRLAQLGHQQLLPQFFTPLAAYAAVRLFQHSEARPERRNTLTGAAWTFVFFAALAAQLYAGFYLGWFLVLGVGLVALWGLALREYRARLLSALDANGMAVAVGATLFVLVLLPMLLHYTEAAREVTRRKYLDAYNTMPELPTWLYVGSAHRLYGWLAERLNFGTGGFLHEEQMGIGFVTSALALGGLWIEQKRPLARVLLLASFTLVLAASLLSHERVLCKLYFEHFPGAYAVRMVPRVCLLMLLPGALGVAFALQRLRETRPFWLAAFACLFVVAEQARHMPAYDKLEVRARVDAIARQVDPACVAFFVTPDEATLTTYELDAMWAATSAGVPTINGYSGNQPPNWPFLSIAYGGPPSRPEVARHLDGWCRLNRLDPRAVLWIDQHTRVRKRLVPVVGEQ